MIWTGFFYCSCLYRIRFFEHLWRRLSLESFLWLSVSRPPSSGCFCKVFNNMNTWILRSSRSFLPYHFELYISLVSDLFSLDSFLSSWFSIWTISPVSSWDGPLFSSLRWKGAHSSSPFTLTTDCASPQTLLDHETPFQFHLQFSAWLSEFFR